MFRDVMSLGLQARGRDAGVRRRPRASCTTARCAARARTPARTPRSRSRGRSPSTRSTARAAGCASRPARPMPSPPARPPRSPATCAARRSRATPRRSSCLARLEPSDLVRMGAACDRVTLGRGDCANCAIGSAAVPDAIAATIEAAEALLGVHDQAPGVRRGRGRAARSERRSAVALASRALPRRLGSDEAGRGRRLGAARTARAHGGRPAPPTGRRCPSSTSGGCGRWRSPSFRPSASVPFPLPALADGCIFCPACTRVCPTDAIRRTFDDAPAAAPTGGVGGRPAQGPMRIELEADRCVGCAACVDVCPVHVVSMRPTVPWAEVVGGVRTVAASTPRRRGGARAGGARRVVG